MKMFIALLALIALNTFSSISNAAILGAPYIPEVDARFNALEGPANVNPKYGSLRADSNAVKHTAQATYDFAVQTGAIGTYSLGVNIPKNAIITRSYIYSITKPTTSASGTLAFKCENAGDILAATAAASFASAGASIDGAVVGGGNASAFKYIDAAAASCAIQAVIATGALTAGKVTAYVEYVLHQ